MAARLQTARALLRHGLRGAAAAERRRVVRRQKPEAGRSLIRPPLSVTRLRVFAGRSSAAATAAALRAATFEAAGAAGAAGTGKGFDALGAAGATAGLVAGAGAGAGAGAARTREGLDALVGTALEATGALQPASLVARLAVLLLEARV